MTHIDSRAQSIAVLSNRGLGLPIVITDNESFFNTIYWTQSGDYKLRCFYTSQAPSWLL